MTVAELLERISARELMEWTAYYQIEPFGEERADLRMGVLASTFANVNRGKHQKPFSPDDFMPKFDRTEPQGRKQTVQEMMQAFKRHTTAAQKT